MKRFSILACLIVVICLGLSSVAMGSGEPAPKKPEAAEEAPVVSLGKTFLIDDFESGNIRTLREWWTFDIETARAVSNQDLTSGDPGVLRKVGSYSLLLKGGAENWYAGGCGAYIAQENQDLSKYDSFQVDIYGHGPGSGTVKIELFDDDNQNWQVEQDPAQAYAPIYDDKYIYDVNVDWIGWRRETILLDDFVDDNPGVGDDIWNPQQKDGSGGFLQIQFVCIAPKVDGTIHYNLDNVSLSVSEE